MINNIHNKTMCLAETFKHINVLISKALACTSQRYRNKRVLPQPVSPIIITGIPHL